MRTYRFFVQGSMIALMAIAASPVLAQTATAPAASDGQATVADIVVTAQRRQESLQKSSVAVNVLDVTALEAVKQARDIGTIVPGVQIAAGGNAPQTFIRGVGAFASTANEQSAVTYNIDGVVIADTPSVMGMTYDLSRIEVLKGPQGTLYGRNSSAGAINYISNHPSTKAYGANFSVDFGNYASVQFTGAVNVPLSATVAVRGAWNYLKHDGYLSDGSDDDRQKGGRLQLLFDNKSNFSVLVSGDIEARDGKGPGSVYLPRPAGFGKFTGIVDSTSTAIFAIPVAFGPGSGFDFANLSGASPRIVVGNNNASVDNQTEGVSAEIRYDFGAVTATLVPAYRHSRNRIDSYLPGLPFAENSNSDQQSYEFRLSHDSDKLKLVGGAYYFKIDQEDSYKTGLAKVRVNFFDNTLKTESYALFGQGSFSLSDRLRLIAGARFTNEKRSITGGSITRNLLAPVLVRDVADAWAKSASFNEWSWRGGVEFDAGAASMLYATVSRGFKAGGFNAAPGADFYAPEIVTAYTVGARNRFFDNSLQLNVEGFWWDITGSQQTHFGFTSTGALGFLTFNAASARSYGAEADMVWRPTRHDIFKVQVAYLNARFGDFQYKIPTSNYFPGSTGCTVTSADAGVSQSFNCSGFELPRSPQFSGNVGYERDFALADGSALIFAANANFGTSRWLAVDYTASQRAEGYVRINGSFTYNFSDGRTWAMAYVRNLTNREVATGGIQGAFTPGVTTASVMPPRTFGLKLGYRF